MNQVKGIDMKTKIRNDMTDKTLWVFEVYYADMASQKKVWRGYPNFISGTYRTKTLCLIAIEGYKKNGATS